MLHAICAVPLMLLLQATLGSVQGIPASSRVPGEISLERGAPVAQSEVALSTVFEGSVFGPDGAPAEGVVVVSSAGGTAITDFSGSFRLEVDVPFDVRVVQLTAVAPGGGNLLASSNVALIGTSGRLHVGRLELSSTSSCSPSWMPTFGPQPGTSSTIHALAVFDDGSGPALYAGGDFLTAGSVEARYIARWDGSSWSAVGSGMSRGVRALAVFDDGTGPALYAAGYFTKADGLQVNNIAKWNGQSWSTVGGGVTHSAFCIVHALTVFDDGGGPKLYAGGTFSSAGGIPANGVARWDGASWTALGTGISESVFDLTPFDDGTGTALFAGGFFSTAGGVTAKNVAKWNGSSWAPVGGGMPGGSIQALASYDAGTGPELYAGGAFGIFRWNGANWTSLGSVAGEVKALSVFDDGSGSALYVGGSFTSAAGVPVNSIAIWNGSTFSGLSDGVQRYSGDGVLAMTFFDDGAGPSLHIGGGFTQAGDVPVRNYARWNGSNWSATSSGSNSTVNAVLVFDDGSGPALYAAGFEAKSLGTTEHYVSRWTGTSWVPLGSGLSGSAKALAVFDDGTGSALYAGGTVYLGVQGTRGYVRRWNGSLWLDVGGEIGGSVDAGVHGLAVFDDGSGSALFVGGTFAIDVNGMAALNIAKWNGTNWSRLRNGLNGPAGAMAVFDDGQGPALYVGGAFTNAGTLATNRIARWNGSSWFALGSGLDGGVGALCVFDDGNGPALFAGGSFTSAGGVSTNRIAKWNGQSWSALGSGVSGSALAGAFIDALLVNDDGQGPALYAGGSFTSAGGVAARYIAKWNGAGWSALAGGLEGSVSTLAAFVDTSGPALIAGGRFLARDSGDADFAKWGCDTPPELSCPSVVYQHDVGAPGEVVSFTVEATDSGHPAPTVVCIPPSGSFFPRGTTLVTCTATDATGNQVTRQFPVIVQMRPVRPR